MPITRFLDEGYAVTAWFMNPNIHPLSEYLRRREAVILACENLGVPIRFADETWDITAWLRSVHPIDTPPKRCHFCCGSRIEAAVLYAVQNGFTAVSSSLLYSIYQPHDFIAQEGAAQAAKAGISFLYRDFRKDWQAGIDMSKAMGLYRQPYCGCIYSEADRYHKKLQRLVKTA